MPGHSLEGAKCFPSIVGALSDVVINFLGSNTKHPSEQSSFNSVSCHSHRC
jgi:hypothetical protein